MHALDLLMQADVTQAAAVRVDWNRLFEADPAAARSPMLSEFVPSPQPPGAATQVIVAPSRSEVVEYLTRLLIETLKLRDIDHIEPRQPLFDLGLDSILAIELRNTLEQRFGLKLPATLLFVHPTIEALASHIAPNESPVLVQAAVVSNSASEGSLDEDQLAEMLRREIEAGR
jgi:myxalamid-type polyketide synthase MxaB